MNTAKQTAIATFVSGMALASAFTNHHLAMPQQAHPISFAASASMSVSSRTMLSVATSSTNPVTISKEPLTPKQDKNQIFMLDEVDSIFDCVDTNGDGEITPDELRAHLVDTMGYSKDYTNYLFQSIDTDMNGSISREELRFSFYNFEALSMYMTFGLGGADVTQNDSFRELAKKSIDGVFQQYYDDVREEDEPRGVELGKPDVRDRLLLNDLADLIFDMIDTDKSGEISRDELQVHFEGVLERLQEKPTAQQAEDYVQTMFETLDANQNGGICREEVREAFGKYDFKLLARTFGLRVYQSQ